MALALPPCSQLTALGVLLRQSAQSSSSPLRLTNNCTMIRIPLKIW